MTVERETLEVDVCIVGGGPAGLACAYHLSGQIEAHNEAVANGSRSGSPIEEPMILLIDKAAEVGNHGFSGAVMNPKGIAELIPDFLEQGMPFESEVKLDEVVYLTQTEPMKFPVTPPPLKNHGNYIISLYQFVRWMAEKTEAKGVEVYPGFPANRILVEGDNVVGVRTGDMGIGKDGQPKGTFEPGMDIKAKVTVLCEGPRGTVTKQLTSLLGLDAGKNPQTYSIGVKEIWEIPEGRVPEGYVAHTMGYPLDRETYGGGFIYSMKDNKLIVGQVVGCDYKDPTMDPHLALQKMKTHPFVREMLEGGTLLRYGAKTIPAGGWWSVPKCWGPGFLLAGDSASLLDGMKLKGIHMAIKSGMLAAETIVENLAAGTTDDDAAMSVYWKKLESSWIKDELWKSRNFHQGFHGGLIKGMVNAGLGQVTGGRGWGVFNRLDADVDHKAMQKKDEYAQTHDGFFNDGTFEFDDKLTFNKDSDVYYSGSTHEGDQPPHLLVPDRDLCSTRCAEEYGNPCQYFCPANVYVIDSESGSAELKLQAENCVHCKTCDIMDPYKNITWTTPEGGGGPNYVDC
jgi:electron-transferring-flavoprotein dehydrogenase